MENNNFRKNSTGSEFVEFNYWEQYYNGEEKKITIAYMLCGEVGNSYKIKNFQEMLSETAVGMDGKCPYFVLVHTVFLPKSYCTIKGDVENMPGFKYIEIPYWIYKKNIDTMIPKRHKDVSNRGQFFVPTTHRGTEYNKQLQDVENQRGLSYLGISPEKYQHYLQQN